MKLIVVRHGPAGHGLPDPDADAARELTEKGRKQTKLAVRGVAKLAPDIGLIVTSPLPRAAQTAKLLSKALGGVELVEDDRLVPPGDAAALIDELRADGKTAAIVGHDPQLSTLVSILPSGASSTFVALDKAGAAALVYESGSWRLDWLMTRDQLAAV
ncbi:MAG: histidine phosphatase family protein [Dehalococcoidia bacterium]